MFQFRATLLLTQARKRCMCLDHPVFTSSYIAYLMIFILQLSPKDLVIMMRDSMTTRSTRITRTTAPDSCLESGQHMPSPSLQDPTWHTWSLGSCCHATCPLLGTCLERDKSQPEPSSDAVRENKPCFSSAMGRFLPAFEISRIKNHHRYSEN